MAWRSVSGGATRDVAMKERKEYRVHGWECQGLREGREGKVMVECKRQRKHGSYSQTLLIFHRANKYARSYWCFACSWCRNLAQQSLAS